VTVAAVAAATALLCSYVGRTSVTQKLKNGDGANDGVNDDGDRSSSGSGLFSRLKKM